ncbi:MAG: Asp-tRNA(Asn)/Glu-tRNA(Gln) amidotransferase subunit GatC [Candidatus Paceibacterota bacterium]|jgi:aspartyl/glutamyl-tRNA(Asn/Gln) amidotransferase C subunit
MKITSKEVVNIAHLARLRLTKDEVIRFQKDLSDILDYIDRIKGAKINETKDISKIDNKNVFRNDQFVDNNEKLFEEKHLSKGYLKTSLIFNEND